MKLQAIIVDDEALGRERIRMLLEKVEDIVVCAECDGGLSAVREIEQRQPDLVFLDIQMPDLDGFGVIARLQETKAAVPVVIFVTAYNEHAVKAFEVNAIDYLLKPVQRKRLESAMDRARSLLAKPELHAWQESLVEMLASREPKKNTFLQRIEVKSQGHTDYVSVSEIYWLQADGNYMELHTRTKTHLARVTLAELERQLDPKQFLRVSRSALVNLPRVRSIQSVGRRGHVALLDDDHKVTVTRSLDELQERLKFSP